MRAAIERLLSPSFGTCWSCRRPWRFVREHPILHRTGSAFALCEACWAQADDATRWRAMFERHGHRDVWPEINRALLDLERHHYHPTGGR